MIQIRRRYSETEKLCFVMTGRVHKCQQHDSCLHDAEVDSSVLECQFTILPRWEVSKKTRIR